MVIDSVIFIISSVTFILFVIGLTISVRARGQAGILTTMKQLFLALSLTSSIVLWIGSAEHSLEMKFVILITHLLLFWSVSFSYILGVFGLPMTSLRMQLLLTIAGFGDRGIGRNQLEKKYSTRTMVAQRLYRLETSGELVRRGSRYMLRSKYSYFMLHNRFLLLLLAIYRPIRKKTHP